MLIPLGVLAVGAVFAGMVFSKLFIGLSTAKGVIDPSKDFWGKAIFEGPNNHILHDMHAIPGWVGWMPFAAMLSGLALAYLYYIQSPWLPSATARAFAPIYNFFLNKWYVDELYDLIFVRPANAIGRFLWKAGDGGVIDRAIDGTANCFGWLTGRASKLQTGYVYHYAFWMLIGLAALLTFAMTSGGFAR